MKIAALLHLYAPDHMAGAETMAHAMLSALAARGHEVNVYMTRPHNRAMPYEYEGVNVFPLRSYSHREIRGDVVISHLENVPRAGSLAMELGVPFVHIIHNTYHQTRRHVEIPTDLLVFNSEWMREDLMEIASSESDTIVVRPLVDPEKYRTTPGTKVTLVNLYSNKGGDLLWRLADLMPDVEFLGVEGAYGHQEIWDAPNVEIWEHAKRPMIDVFAQTKILIMPSSYESWGRVGVEAMCSGIPVIAHPTAGLKESLGHAGIFLPRYNMRAWTSVIDTLLTRPAAYRVASALASIRSAELDPTAEMNAWCDRVEHLQIRRRAVSVDTSSDVLFQPLPLEQVRAMTENAPRVIAEINEKVAARSFVKTR